MENSAEAVQFLKDFNIGNEPEHTQTADRRTQGNTLTLQEEFQEE